MELLTKIELLTKEEMKEWNLSDVVSVAINLGIYYHAGQEKGLDILTANKQILIEKIIDIFNKERIKLPMTKVVGIMQKDSNYEKGKNV